MTTVEVRAPATTANLGPGYDCLGMALDLWNTLTVEVLPAGSKPAVVVLGEGAGELEADAQNLTLPCHGIFVQRSRRSAPPVVTSLQ